MDEFWDVYDKNRVFQNRTMKRGEPFADGDYHVRCEVIIQNPKKEFLVTLRSPNKKAGGLWEFIGGGVLAGETTIQAAIREVNEEVGVKVEESELRFMLEYKRKNYFMDVFSVVKDVDISDIVLDENETADAKWVSEKELQNMIDGNMVVHSVAERYNLLKDKL